MKKMSNFEMIKAHNALTILQNLETEMFQKTGKRLFQGRIKIGYAINKNISNFIDALKPYQETLAELEKTYRDVDAEQTAVQKAKENGLEAIEMIFKDESKKDEFFEKRKELLEIESEVNIYEVSLDLLDGIELNSTEIATLMFMIRE